MRIAALSLLLVLVSGCNEVIDLGDELRFERKPKEAPTDAPPCPEARWIRDTFAGNDYRREIWQEPSVNPEGALGFVDERVEVTLGSDVYHLGRFDALLPLSLRESRIELELVEAPTAASGATFSILFIVPAHTAGLELVVSQGVLRVASWNVDTDGFFVPVEVPYDPASHRWLRIEHGDHSIAVATSPDGTSWHEESRDPEINFPAPLDELLFIVMAFTEDPPVTGQDTRVRFDNIGGTLCLPGD